MKTSLQISSGRGPVEVRRFVRLLADRLAEELGAESRFTGEAMAPLSATLHVETSAALAWVGTHQLLAPLRGKGGRKRWFAEVRAFDEAPTAEEPDVQLSAARAGGPGGQNVNKRATAVRAVDRQSGLSVRVSDQRSQARNRALALQRLHGRLEEREREAAAKSVAEHRAAHDKIVRGDATFTWRLGPDGRLLGEP